MARDAEKNNEKLLPIFRKNLSDGDLHTYSATADKLTVWLSRDKAYYASARPAIIELLETAHARVRRASGIPDQPFSITKCPPSLRPWAEPFIRMVQTVRPFASLFTEPNLQARLHALLSASSESPSREYTPMAESVRSLGAESSTNRISPDAIQQPYVQSSMSTTHPSMVSGAIPQLSFGAGVIPDRTSTPIRPWQSSQGGSVASIIPTPAEVVSEQPGYFGRPVSRGSISGMLPRSPARATFSQSPVATPGPVQTPPVVPISAEVPLPHLNARITSPFVQTPSPNTPTFPFRPDYPAARVSPVSISPVSTQSPFALPRPSSQAPPSSAVPNLTGMPPHRPSSRASQPVPSPLGYGPTIQAPVAHIGAHRLSVSSPLPHTPSEIPSMSPTTPGHFASTSSTVPPAGPRPPSSSTSGSHPQAVPGRKAKPKIKRKTIDPQDFILADLEWFKDGKQLATKQSVGGDSTPVPAPVATAPSTSAEVHPKVSEQANVELSDTASSLSENSFGIGPSATNTATKQDDDKSVKITNSTPETKPSRGDDSVVAPQEVRQAKPASPFATSPTTSRKRKTMRPKKGLPGLKFIPITPKVDDEETSRLTSTMETTVPTQIIVTAENKSHDVASTSQGVLERSAPVQQEDNERPPEPHLIPPGVQEHEALTLSEGSVVASGRPLDTTAGETGTLKDAILSHRVVPDEDVHMHDTTAVCDDLQERELTLVGLEGAPLEGESASQDMENPPVLDVLPAGGVDEQDIDVAGVEVEDAIIDHASDTNISMSEPLMSSNDPPSNTSGDAPVTPMAITSDVVAEELSGENLLQSQARDEAMLNAVAEDVEVLTTEEKIALTLDNLSEEQTQSESNSLSRKRSRSSSLITAGQPSEQRRRTQSSPPLSMVVATQSDEPELLCLSGHPSADGLLTEEADQAMTTVNSLCETEVPPSSTADEAQQAEEPSNTPVGFARQPVDPGHQDATGVESPLQASGYPNVTIYDRQKSESADSGPLESSVKEEVVTSVMDTDTDGETANTVEAHGDESLVEALLSKPSEEVDQADFPMETGTSIEDPEEGQISSGSPSQMLSPTTMGGATADEEATATAQSTELENGTTQASSGLESRVSSTSDSSMLVVSCARGTADRHIDFDFVIDIEDAASISQWVARHDTQEDVSLSRCFSFASYQFSDCLAKARSNPDISLAEMTVGLSTVWPTDGKLWAELKNEKGEYRFRLSPPFITKTQLEDVFDLSEKVSVGKNVLRVFQLRDYSDYVFVIRVHKPTASQLEELQQRRAEEEHWQQFLRDMGKFDLPPPSFSDILATMLQ